jgi:hypothetical protein
VPTDIAQRYARLIAAAQSDERRSSRRPGSVAVI